MLMLFFHQGFLSNSFESGRALQIELELELFVFEGGKTEYPEKYELCLLAMNFFCFDYVFQILWGTVGAYR